MSAEVFDREYRNRLRERRRARRRLKDVAIAVALLAVWIVVLSADAWLVHP